MKRSRWLVVLCAVGIHISIGSIYAWSQIAASIKLHLTTSWNLVQITLTFAIAIFFIGLATAFLGRFVEKKGPRTTGMIAALLFGSGLVGGGVAIHVQWLWLLYLTYGAIGGLGIGLAYITPIPALLKWFPDRRGLAMGITIMGFGFGAAIEVLVLENLLPRFGVHNVATGMIILGCCYFILIFISSLYLAPPPEDWSLPGFATKNNSSKQVTTDLAQLTAREAIKTRRFYYLWLMLFINVTCGIAIISVAKVMGHEIIGLTMQMAAVMVIIMSLFNGFGRIAWAAISDYITRPVTYTLFFIIQIIAFLLLSYTRDQFFFQVLVFLVLSCYGGGFALAPALVGDIFGTKEAGTIYGYILTAWAMAGLVGPMLISIIKNFTGSYVASLYIFVGFLVIALILSILMTLNIRTVRACPKNRL